MTRKQWLNLARVLVSVGALGFLFWKIGLGETLDVLRAADLRLLALALLLFLVSLLVRAGRWAVLLRALNLPVCPSGGSSTCTSWALSSTVSCPPASAGTWYGRWN
jgi:uncharacterized membrane protein YbhN (UPF0104 family)